MSDQREGALRPEDAADAAASSPEAAAAAADPSEERLNEASPDDAAGAAGRAGADGPAAGADDDGQPAGEAAPDGEAPPGTAADDGAPQAAPAEAEVDFRDRYVRAVAEFDNVRKRLTRQASLAETRGIARLAREVLPALDDLERALAAAPQDDPMRDGVRIVHERLIASLAKVGIEPDAPKGERFDPHLHEALAQQPVEGVASGTIVEVYSNGYRLGDDVLRPAKVVVAA